MPEPLYEWLQGVAAELGYGSMTAFAQDALREKCIAAGKMPPLDMTPKAVGGPRPATRADDGRRKAGRHD